MNCLIVRMLSIKTYKIPFKQYKNFFVYYQQILLSNYFYMNEVAVLFLADFYQLNKTRTLDRGKFLKILFNRIGKQRRNNFNDFVPLTIKFVLLA